MIVTIGYESASGGSSVPSLGVENCDYMVTLPCPHPPVHGHDRITMQIAVILLVAKGLKCLCLLIHS